MSLFTKEKQTHKLREKTSDCQGVKKRGEEDIVREFGMDRYTLLCLKWIPTRNYV